jgi:hypothetical protein
MRKVKRYLEAEFPNPGNILDKGKVANLLNQGRSWKKRYMRKRQEVNITSLVLFLSP